MEYSEGGQGWLQVWLNTCLSKAGHLSSAQDGLCGGGEKVYKLITRTEKMNKEQLFVFPCHINKIIYPMTGLKAVKKQFQREQFSTQQDIELYDSLLN